MIRARSAFTLALLLSSTVLTNAQSEEILKSVESWEIDEIANEDNAESTTASASTTTHSASFESWEVDEDEKSETTTPLTTKSTSSEPIQATGKQALRAFVTPRPFVVDHPLFSSTWGVWSAWSFCVNNVRIRVRACNTVRGFSCVGNNQETEPCANSLYHHHPARPKQQSDYDVVDPYEDDRIEALKQLYPDESPSDVLGRRRPNPNFLRIGTAAPKIPGAEPRLLTSIEKAEEIEEKDTNKAKEAGQQPEVDFKKAKGAKTETQEIPLQAEIEGALEKLEVHRDSETRRQHSASYHTLNQKALYAHDGSMGTGYTLIRNAASVVSALDLLEPTNDSSPRSTVSGTAHDAGTDIEKYGKENRAKIQKSKAALAKISELLDYEIDALEKKVTTKSVNIGGNGLRAVFQSRGEEAPGVVGPGTIDPKYSKLAGAYVGAGRSTTPVPGEKSKSANKENGSDYVDYSDYEELDNHGKRIATTPKPKTKAATKEVKARSTIYDEAVLDTDKATYDEYEEWIGDDKGSKEIINRRTNLKKGVQHDSETVAIPFRSRASRTTVHTAAPSFTSTAPSIGKQRKINFDNSDFFKEILSSDYEDVTSGKKLDGDARISATTSAPHTTARPPVTPSRSDQLNKVHELENLLGLPHQGLMEETTHHQTNPVVFATPTPQFRSEGGSHRRNKIVKKVNKAKTSSRVDIDNADVDKQVNMIDSDIHIFDGESRVAPKPKVQQRKTVHRKVLKNRTKFREQPPLVDNDDFSRVKGYSPYPSMRRPANRGRPQNKALSIGVTGKRHRAILDSQKAQEIIKSHKIKRNNLRRYLLMSKINSKKPMAINDDTVRVLDWMMQSLGATELLETKKLARNKYQHARVNSHARAEISAGIQQATRKKPTIVDSVAIGSPVPQRRPAPVYRPAKILPPHKKIVAYQSQPFTKVHDSDLLWTRPQEGISRMKPLHKTSRGESHTTPLRQYPPDLRAYTPKQKSLTPALETQPFNLLPPPLDEATDAVRYPRNGAYGNGFELDGSSPDAAAYHAAEGTARPAKILPTRPEHRARGVKTVTGVERKRLIGGAYTSTSGAAAFPSKFVDQKTPPRQPVAGLPEQYLKSQTTLLDSDAFTASTVERPATPTKKESHEKKPVPFVMHEGSMDEANTIAAEIERLEELVNNNKEHFNPPTFSDKGGLALPKEFENLLSDPRLYEDALKEIKEENKLLGVSDTTNNAVTKNPGSEPRWSEWRDWGESLCGQQLRTRACETADGTQVPGCKGTSYQSQSCSGGSCPAH